MDFQCLTSRVDVVDAARSRAAMLNLRTTGWVRFACETQLSRNTKCRRKLSAAATHRLDLICVICRFAKVNVNKVNICYVIVLLL